MLSIDETFSLVNMFYLIQRACLVLYYAGLNLGRLNHLTVPFCLTFVNVHQHMFQKGRLLALFSWTIIQS